MVSKMEDQKVPFNKIVPTQPDIFQDILDKYLAGARQTKYTHMIIPYFIFYKNKYYLFEGHHRVIANYLMKKPIRGVVLYMDKSYYV